MINRSRRFHPSFRLFPYAYLIMILLLLFFSVGQTFAAEPSIAAPPAREAADYEVFYARYLNLEKRRIPLTRRIRVQVSSCNNVATDDRQLVSWCRQEGREIVPIWKAYEESVHQYQDDLRLAKRSRSSKEKALLLGYAFKMGDRMRAYAHQSLKSLKDVSRILIGVWNAERGSYEKARHLASLSNVNDDVLKDLDDILLSLEREQRALLKKEITRTVISGKFNGRLFSRYPINFSLSLVRAHTAIKSHDYDMALRQLAVARKMTIESPALADAELYVRQMKASAMEKKYPSNPALITHQANMDAPAALVLADSAKTLAREGNIEDSKTIFRLANTIPGRQEANGGGLPASGVYDSASEPDIFFDALDYGNHDWKRSLQFLNIAHKAAPNNERISEAMAHVQAFMASEVK